MKKSLVYIAIAAIAAFGFTVSCKTSSPSQQESMLP